jgi:NADPH:quinone reductase-like Zn-dependent oxidoreductase
MAEKTVIRPQQFVLVPDDMEDVTAAAIGNPGMSCWAALKERAAFAPGESILINGATGTAGRIAIQVAKHMGARKIVATGRNLQTLQSLSALGADVVLPIGDADDAFEEVLKEQFADGIDVVLDYLWGPSAERILIAAAKAGRDTIPIRFVQIGTASAPNISLPGAVLRSTAITLMGSGIGSVPADKLMASIGEVMQAAAASRFEIETRTFPLSDVERVWTMPENTQRTVFQIS